MIDIKKAEEEFMNYTSKYNVNEPPISRKVYHTFRVEELCEKISISIGMNEEDINLAKIIGLLHDIARFEQYTRYKTYDDIKSIDHGNLGVEILEEDNYIRKYIETDEYDDIIKKAIWNHNKYVIDSNLNEKEKLFCKIIRDADKLDIMYLATTESWADNVKELEEQLITQEVLEQFYSKSTIDRINVKNYIDRVIVVLAFVYDLNFKESYKIIEQNNYIDKIINRFNFKEKETREQMELIRKIANNYISKEI